MVDIVCSSSFESSNKTYILLVNIKVCREKENYHRGHYDSNVSPPTSWGNLALEMIPKGKLKQRR